MDSVEPFHTTKRKSRRKNKVSTGLSFLGGEFVGTGLEPGGALEQLDLLLVGKLGQIVGLDLVDDVTGTTEAWKVLISDFSLKFYASKI